MILNDYMKKWLQIKPHSTEIANFFIQLLHDKDSKKNSTTMHDALIFVCDNLQSVDVNDYQRLYNNMYIAIDRRVMEFDLDDYWDILEKIYVFFQPCAIQLKPFPMFTDLENRSGFLQSMAFGGEQLLVFDDTKKIFKISRLKLEMPVSPQILTLHGVSWVDAMVHDLLLSECPLSNNYLSSNADVAQMALTLSISDGRYILDDELTPDEAIRALMGESAWQQWCGYKIQWGFETLDAYVDSLEVATAKDTDKYVRRMTSKNYHTLRKTIEEMYQFLTVVLNSGMGLSP